MNSYYLTTVSLFLFTTIHSSISSCFQLSVGQQVGIPVPSAYEAGFRGRAFLATAGDAIPQFKAALSVETTANGRYSCSLVVLLGELKAWASDHHIRFIPEVQCTLEMTKAGELRLKDVSGTVGWSSNTSGLGAESILLRTTGNLVLVNSENQTIWQSFDHPGDVMLWSQVLIVQSNLTSTIAHSVGFYSFEIQHNRIALYLNAADGRRYSYWELPHSRGLNISYVKLGSEGLKVFGNRSRKIAQLPKPHAAEPVRFLMLGGNGFLTIYHYSAINGSFKASYRAPSATCDLPFPCGQHGVCARSGSCSCIQIPSMEQNSSDVNCSKTLLPVDYCGAQYEVEMQQIVSADTALRTAASSTNITQDKCLDSCVDNCSCLATMYANSSGQCFHYGMVGGIREVDKEDGVTYWIKVPSETSKDEKRTLSIKLRIIIIAAAVDGMAICFLLGGLTYYLLVVRRKKEAMRRGINTR